MIDLKLEESGMTQVFSINFIDLNGRFVIKDFPTKEEATSYCQQVGHPELIKEIKVNPRYLSPLEQGNLVQMMKRVWGE